jgi:hypothetical protein
MMTVTETTYRAGGSSSRSTTERRAKRSFIVRYDAVSPPSSLAAVETADDGTTAIPALGDALAGDSARLATSIDVKPRGDSGHLFDVEVGYSTSDTGLEVFDNPLSDPVGFEWDFSTSSQTYFKDETTPTAKYTLTSAGEPFDNLLEREVGEITVTVTQNIAPAGWNPITAASYLSPATAVNNASMTIDGASIAAGQARLSGVTCSATKTRAGVSYRTRTITIKLRSSWDQTIDDRGFNEADPDHSGKVREITKGAPPVKVDKPWPLNGSGAAKPNATDAPAVLTFKPYPAKDFSVWGIV